MIENSLSSQIEFDLTGIPRDLGPNANSQSQHLSSK